jgi:hypothetical protein
MADARGEEQVPLGDWKLFVLRLDLGQRSHGALTIAWTAAPAAVTVASMRATGRAGRIGPVNGAIRLGAREIVLPTAGESRCYIFHDLADLLGLEYNAEALELFRSEWTKRGKRGRLDLDREADRVAIYARRGAILEVAVLCHELARPSIPRPTPDEIASARLALKHHRRPERLPWEVGDLFAAPLRDDSFAIGQILWEPSREGVRAPTVALLEYRVNALEDIDPEELDTCRTIAILHVRPESLDTGRWHVLERRQVHLDPFSGPAGHPFEVGGTSWDGLEILANAWHGLAPRNASFRSDDLDERLLRGIVRPASAWMLTRQERAARSPGRR